MNLFKKLIHFIWLVILEEYYAFRIASLIDALESLRGETSDANIRLKIGLESKLMTFEKIHSAIVGEMKGEERHSLAPSS